MLKEIYRLTEIIRIVVKYKLYNFYRLNNIDDNKESYSNFRQALEELGPIFIKFGQLLSTRNDLLPRDFIQELSKLQDKVRPFNSNIARDIIKADLKNNCYEILDGFSANPMASASVAQVHAAKIDGKEVVVKILRPDLKKLIAKDLRLLKFLINKITKILPDLNRFKPVELVVELERVLIDEQDLLREAANASQLKRNFKDNNILYIPQVYWQYCSKNILVLERIYGISINNIDKLKELNVDLNLLAKRGVELFFKQVFEDCLFHGDLHPGNIFVNADNPNDPKFYAIDFGIMGTLGPEEQFYLASNLWAFLNKDYRKVAELHIESGWVDSTTRIDLFEAAIRTVSEPILEKPVSEISFGELLVKLFDVARDYNMQLQPQLLVFKKSLINLEGIAHQLDPNLNLWETSRPFIEKWMHSQIGITAAYNKLKANFPHWIHIFFDTPELVYKFLNKNIMKTNRLDKLDNSTKKHSKLPSLFFILLACAAILILNYNDILELYNKYSFVINNIAAGLLLLYGLISYFRGNYGRNNQARIFQ